MAQTNTNNHLGINKYENNVWNHGTKIILQFKTLHTRKVIPCPKNWDSTYKCSHKSCHATSAWIVTNKTNFHHTESQP